MVLARTPTRAVSMHLGLLTEWCLVLRGRVPVASIPRDRTRKLPGQLRTMLGAGLTPLLSYRAPWPSMEWRNAPLLGRGVEGHIAEECMVGGTALWPSLEKRICRRGISV